MCRYASNYKEHHACFKCRKMFRQPQSYEMARPIDRQARREVSCPQCGARMANMGKDFKAPRQADVKQWMKVEMLFANGYNFSSCGCSGPGPRPATLKEVKPFLAEQKRLKLEWARQAVIQKHAVELTEKRTRRARLLNEKRIGKVIKVDAIE